MDVVEGEGRRGTKRKYSGDNGRVSARAQTPADVTTSASHPLSGHGYGHAHASTFPPSLSPQPEEIDERSLDARERRFATLYATELDFRRLGEQDEDLRALLGGERASHLDFADPRAVMQLTKTLLRLDFGLRIELPPDRLCPPVPNRHNYILWLKELLDSTSACYTGTYDPARRVLGLDVGTGASLIYPLLGCAQRPRWSFLATDVDAKSLAHARRNAELNGLLGSRVRVVDRDVAAPFLVPLDDLGVDALDFVMVNPPFYTSESELLDLARQKSRPPNSACTGAPIEMVCEGGEIGFVQRIIDESLVLRGRVQWYTSMLGKQSSLDVCVARLRAHGIDNYAVTAFVQGNKTRRWALGWSFDRRRPSARASRGFEPTAGKKLLPHPTELTAFEGSLSNCGPGALETALCDAMESLDLVSWRWDRPASRGVGFAAGNVWARAYRRRNKRPAMLRGDDSSSGNVEPCTKPSNPETTTDLKDCSFGFAVSVHVDGDGAHDTKDRVKVEVRWLQGQEYALFESFTGTLRNVVLRVLRGHVDDAAAKKSKGSSPAGAD